MDIAALILVNLNKIFPKPKRPCSRIPDSEDLIIPTNPATIDYFETQLNGADVKYGRYHKHIDFQITFVGLVKEKEYMDRLQEYIFTKGMSDNVRFTGFLAGQGLSEEYEKADIFVSPTLKEGFGLTVLEAMSYGLPVVASNVGAIPELIENRINGLLVEPEDPELLARAIRELIDGLDLTEKVKSNIKPYLARFKTIEEQLNQFYSKVANLIA